MRYLLLAMCVAGVACAKGAADTGGDDDDDGQGGASSTSTSTSGTGGSTSTGTGGASSTSSGTTGCGPTEMLCGGICVDIMANNSHCGTCDVLCMGGEECMNGACMPSSSSSSSTSSTSSSSTSSTSTTSTTSSSTSSTSTSGTCDPLNPVPVCGGGAHCAPQTNGVPLCSPPVGSGTQYSACVSSDDCAAIYECANTGSYAWCMQWCSNDFDCPGWPLDTCAFFATPVYVGSIEWGACWDGYP
ncbi:MAG: hypothetical protein JRI68_04965 [Deltaproteobacteria bacterium]|nr:hypothetical protein [Deltaproteobacteria bacterium]